MFVFREFPPQDGNNISFQRDVVTRAGIDMVEAGAVFASLLIANINASDQDTFGRLKEPMLDEAFEGEKKNIDRVNFNSGFWPIIEPVVLERSTGQTRDEVATGVGRL